MRLDRAERTVGAFKSMHAAPWDGPADSQPAKRVIVWSVEHGAILVMPDWRMNIGATLRAAVASARAVVAHAGALLRQDTTT